MPRPQKAVVPDYRPRALAAADVGTWRSSIAEQRGFCDAVMAGMFGLTEAEAHHGFPLSRVRDIIHPDDRAVFDQRTGHHEAAGGHIVMEYRIRPRPGDLRWILVRGRYDRPPDSIGMMGHGIAIDITASKAPDRGEAGRLYAATPPPGSPPGALRRAADAAIALHREAERLEADLPGLRLLADLALHAIGRELAGRAFPDDLD